MVFLQTIASRYYPIFVVAMQLSLIIYNREAGPMLFAERRAKVTTPLGPPAPPPGSHRQQHWAPAHACTGPRSLAFAVPSTTDPPSLQLEGKLMVDNANRAFHH
jgi:Na+/H+ antiporter NhaC